MSIEQNMSGQHDAYVQCVVYPGHPHLQFQAPLTSRDLSSRHGLLLLIGKMVVLHPYDSLPDESEATKV